MTTLIITQSAQNTTIDKLVSSKYEDVADDKHIWIHLSGQIDWADKGCGFIYRNFRGAKKTLGEALNHLYRVMNFLGGEWKLEKCEPNHISYTRENGREYILRYNLDEPSIFDMNH